jgi:hypothetical protein
MKYWLMSQMGQSLPKWAVSVTSAFPPIATELRTLLEVRFVPTSDINAYSITSSARKSRDDGSVSPMACAAFTLTMS